MQKFADLKLIGKSLKIISVFSVEHIKGFVFIEREKQSDVSETCWQLADHSLVTLRRKNRVKSELVVAVNNLRKRTTAQLVPRIDLQALAGKVGVLSSHTIQARQGHWQIC